MVKLVGRMDIEDILDKVHCSDNVKFLQRVPDESIDLTVTSPPYDKIRMYSGYSWNAEELINQLYKKTKQGGIVCWVVQDQYVHGFKTLSSFEQALLFDTRGLKMCDEIIYEKSAFAYPSPTRYQQVWEHVFIFSKGKPKTFNPLMDRENKSYIKGYTFGKKRRKDDGTMTHENDTSRIEIDQYGKRFNVWRYAVGKGNSTRDDIAYDHPAIFPDQLAEDLIKSYSNQGDIVCDPFMGSGTVGKMALLNHRRYIGIDISEEYCKIAKKRINMYKKRMKMFGEYRY